MVGGIGVEEILIDFNVALQKNRNCKKCGKWVVNVAANNMHFVQCFGRGKIQRKTNIKHKSAKCFTGCVSVFLTVCFPHFGSTGKFIEQNRLSRASSSFVHFLSTTFPLPSLLHDYDIYFQCAHWVKVNIIFDSIIIISIDLLAEINEYFGRQNTITIPLEEDFTPKWTCIIVRKCTHEGVVDW